MKIALLTILFIFALIFILDFIWLKFIAGDFFLQESKSFGRIKDGNFEIVVWSAMLTWAVMAFGIYFFVLKNSFSIDYLSVFAIGAFLGFVLYAVFDFTNYSFIKDYSLKFILVDILWGSFLVGIVSLITFHFFS